MARDTIIAERPVPPKGRLSFPMLILHMIANPVASWGEDFYEEPAVLYRWLGLQTLYVMDPVLIQRIDRDMAGTTLQALQDTVLGAGLGDDDRRVIQEAGATFLFYSMWKVVLTSLRLPPTIPLLRWFRHLESETRRGRSPRSSRRHSDRRSRHKQCPE
jgi:hypothetical protein